MLTPILSPLNIKEKKMKRKESEKWETEIRYLKSTVFWQLKYDFQNIQPV